MPADIHSRPVTVLALAGAGLCLTLMAARAASVLSFAEPLHLFTSGDETASLFAVWQAIHGAEVYTSRFESPFNAPFFNGLFYAFYGWAVGLTQHLLTLDEAWQPTLGRLLTLAAAGVVAGAGYGGFRWLWRERGVAGGGAFLAALAAFVAVGPLVGFWALTVRPDLWALALEVTAAVLFLRLQAGRPWTALLALAVGVYLAWSFKQTAVLVGGGAGLFLLVRRRWGQALVLAAVMAAAWGATLWLGGEIYRGTVLMEDVSLHYAVSRAVRNLANFAAKAGPYLVPFGFMAAAAAGDRRLRQRLMADDAVVFAVAGSAVAAALAVPATSQTGASENYFFTLSFLLALAVVAAAPLVTSGDGRWAKGYTIATGLGWAAAAAGALAVLSGWAGIVDAGVQHRHFTEAKACLDPLPRPLYVADRYLSLPWMTPGTTPFVLSYTYERDRAAGRRFAGGGIGGMVEARAFAALAVPGKAPPRMLDGGSLDGYTLLPERCANMNIFLRKESDRGEHGV